MFGGLLFFIVVLFLAFGPLKGTLEDKFVIPGSDAQRATDVLAAKFGARNGGTLQVVMQAPAGQRLDAPDRKAAIASALADAGKAEHATNVDGPFKNDNQRFSKTDPRIGYAEVQFDEDGFELDRAKIVDLEDAIEGEADHGRRHDRVHRRCRAGAAGAGGERVHRLREWRCSCCCSCSARSSRPACRSSSRCSRWARRSACSTCSRT